MDSVGTSAPPGALEDAQEPKGNTATATPVDPSAPPRPERVETTEQSREPRWPSHRLLVASAVAVMAVGLVLRFWTTSDLWLDEALTVNISRQPLSKLHFLLNRDGAPPLYYVLLHFWMKIFGTSDLGVRSLSGVLSCATLPFVWVAGRRLGGRTVAASALVLTAVSPFAIRYATETRMYSLVALLVAAGIVAMQRSIPTPTRWNLIAVGLCTALLLYTHYWAIYMVGVVILWLAFQIWRGPERLRRGARRSLGAVIVGCVLFIPWVPSFLYQSAHTGTPWAAPADFAAMVDAISSFAGGANSSGRALALLYFALAGLGLFGVARGRLHVDLDLRTQPRARVFAIAVAGTLAVAVVGGYLSSSAFQPRYAMIVFVPLVLLVALGMATLADRRIRAVVLVVAVALGLAGGFSDVWTNRTQAGQVSAAIAQLGRPGDVVAYCPDQLGPAVSRLLPDHRYVQITFPRGTGPQFVNWVDYAKASAAGDPAAFASKLEQLAGPTHQIWYVWMSGYQTFGTKCEAIEQNLLADRDLGAREQFPPHPIEFYEPMELVRFVPVGH